MRGSVRYRTLLLEARRLRLAWNRRLHPKRWSDADPYKLLVVDPRSIVLKQWNHVFDDPTLDYDMTYFHRLTNTNKVAGGDWDLRTNPFADNLTCRIISEHFEKGVPWHETEAFAVFDAVIRSGVPIWHGCRSRADLLERCADVERLHASLQRHDYQPRPRYLFDEITVSIARDGELIYNSDGAHRLSLSKVLRVPTVHVRVLVRHAEWQAIRDDVIAAGPGGPLGERAARHVLHPDLADLLPAASRAANHDPVERLDGTAACGGAAVARDRGE